MIGFALVGLVLGWLLRPLEHPARRYRAHGGLAAGGRAAFVALVVGAVAWSTYRSLHRRHERLQPHHAVNRLVLAKACALAGALFAGGYLGYALSWLGLTDAELAQERVRHSLFGGLAGGALVVGSLLLERACRVGKDEG